MGKRFKSKKTLTKIDVSTLRPKVQAVSQHASEDGTPITAPVNPVCDLVEDLDSFNADALNSMDKYLEDVVSEDEAAREYYVARVCLSVFPSVYKDSSSLGQPSPVNEGGTTTFPRRIHSSGRPGGFH